MGRRRIPRTGIWYRLLREHSLGPVRATAFFLYEGTLGTAVTKETGSPTGMGVEAPAVAMAMPAASRYSQREPPGWYPRWLPAPPLGMASVLAQVEEASKATVTVLIPLCR